MAVANEKNILDRMHAIHQTITSVPVYPYRYWRAPVNNAQYPMIIPIFRSATRERRWDAQRQTRRTFVIVVVCGSVQAGLPNESAAKVAENVTPLICEAYDTRDRLQLNSDILTGLISAQLGDDTGQTVTDDGLLVMEFNLEVTYLQADSLL